MDVGGPPPKSTAAHAARKSRVERERSGGQRILRPFNAHPAPASPAEQPRARGLSPHVSR